MIKIGSTSAARLPNLSFKNKLQIRKQYLFVFLKLRSLTDLKNEIKFKGNFNHSSPPLLFGTLQDSFNAQCLIKCVRHSYTSIIRTMVGLDAISNPNVTCFTPFTPSQERKDMQLMTNFNYWITVKGCLSLTQCHSLLRPWWTGRKCHLFCLVFKT